MSFKQLTRILSAAFILLLSTGLAGAQTFRIVAFGDSLVAGHQLAPGEGLPERLEAALKARGRDVSVANAGVSGETTSGGLARLDWSIQGEPDLVILELGANDMLRGLSPQMARDNLDAMIVRLKERGIPVLLAGMRAAPNLGPDYVETFDAIYPALAEKHDLMLYPFFLEGVAANEAMLLDDGLHPNAAGVDRIVEGILPMVETMIERQTDRD